MLCLSSLSLTGVLVAILVAIISFYKRKYQCWKKKNLPYIEPSIPFGNLPNTSLSKVPFQQTFDDIYREFRKQGVKHGGFYFFASPAYMPVDLQYIKNIITKDFAHFTDRGAYYNEKSDPLSAHLFAIGGTKWRNLRVKLSPTFTSGKMRDIFGTLVKCGKAFRGFIDEVVEQGVPLHIKDLTSCFTTDVIGSCAFGLECHTIIDENSPFRKYGRDILIPSRFRTLLILGLGLTYPQLARYLGITVLPSDSSHFFMNVVKTAVEYREKNDYRRNDFLQILIDLKNNKLAGEIVGEHDGKTLTIEEIAAQCLVFYLGGFETSSTLMSFALLELSQKPELQDKVREEINQVLKKYNGEITYDGIMEMKYMQQVLDETLRLYPPISFITSECVKDYRVPDTDVVIEKGTKCFLSIMGIHHDEAYYPNPEVFDPDRFSDENKATRNQYAFLPFGEGPRICIGMRFGYMQSKVGLTVLLRNYKFALDPKTELPIQFDPAAVITSAKGGVWLQAKRV